MTLSLLRTPLNRWYIALLFIPVLFACTQPVRRIEPDNLVWPTPPDVPRIKYIQSIFEEDDIGREYSLKEQLFGKEYFDSMSRPYGVTARRGRIYVTDLTMKGIFIFDLAVKRMIFVGGEGKMQVPSSVIVDSSGTIYVADAGSSKIVVYGANGAYLTTYPLPDARPVSLAVNNSLGRIYVVERNTHRILVLGLDGNKLFEFGEQGDREGQFNIPLSIALDAEGTVYVLDSGNFRVQIFDTDGKYLSKFGEVGDRSGMFANPKGIAVDSERHIYVTDAAFSNFQIFDRSGAFLLNVGTLGALPGQLHLPGGIAIDENDRIFVADQFNRRIQVFQYLKAP